MGTHVSFYLNNKLLVIITKPINQLKQKLHVQFVDTLYPRNAFLINLFSQVLVVYC